MQHQLRNQFTALGWSAGIAGRLAHFRRRNETSACPGGRTSAPRAGGPRKYRGRRDGKFAKQRSAGVRAFARTADRMALCAHALGQSAALLLQRARRGLLCQAGQRAQHQTSSCKSADHSDARRHELCVSLFATDFLSGHLGGQQGRCLANQPANLLREHVDT